MSYIKIKSSHTIILGCLFVLCAGLLWATPLVFAEEKNTISVPPEGFLPLGSLSTQNPALFDVVAEPVQSIKSSSHPVTVSITVGIVLAVLILLITKFRKKYGDTKYEKEILRTAEKKI